MVVSIHCRPWWRIAVGDLLADWRGSLHVLDGLGGHGRGSLGSRARLRLREHRLRATCRWRCSENVGVGGISLVGGVLGAVTRLSSVFPVLLCGILGHRVYAAVAARPPDLLKNIRSGLQGTPTCTALVACSSRFRGAEMGLKAKATVPTKWMSEQWQQVDENDGEL